MKKIIYQPIISHQETGKIIKANYFDSDVKLIAPEFLEFMPIPCLVLKTDFTVLQYNQEVLKLLNIHATQLFQANFLYALNLKVKDQKTIKSGLRAIKQNDFFYFKLNHKEHKYAMFFKKNKTKQGILYVLNLLPNYANKNINEEELNYILRYSLTATWVLNMGDLSFKLDNFNQNIFPEHKISALNVLDDFIKLIYHEDRDRVKEALLKAKKHKELDVEFRMLNENYYPIYFSMKGNFFTSSDDRKQYLAGIIIDITEKINLQKQADNLRLNQQRIILDATFWAQEKERKKISEVLHDSVSQLLYGIRLNIQSLQRSGYKNKEFANINCLLDQAVKEIRAIAYELKPSILIDFGFVSGVKELAERLSTANFSIKAYVNTQADNLHPEVQLSLFRVIQELINNSIKHAEATSSEIIVFVDDEKVDLSVNDNGKGFDIKHPEVLKGSGIRGIKNRIFLLNGEFNIQSKKGKGTHIAIRFKIKDAIAALSVI